MPLSASYVSVADYLYNLFLTNQEALGLYAVYYGDQNRIAGNPVVCVEPDTKSNNLNGAPRRVLVTTTTYILVYFAAVGSPQDNRHYSDELAEQIETLIHTDSKMGGLVIHSLVSEIRSGYTNKAGTIMKSARLAVTTESQTQLPMP